MSHQPTVLTVVGARPQFIKAAPVSRALLEAGLGEQLLHTGQHYDRPLSDLLFEQLGLQAPRWHLGVGSASHGVQTARMLEGIETHIEEERPDVVLIYGDTNSTLAAALAAAKLHVPVAHVEAGLRSFDRRMPEEINRLVADELSSLLFAPTPIAVKNLQNEGITKGVHEVGDVMADALAMFGAHVGEGPPALVPGLQSGGYGVATLHRAANTDSAERLASILEGLAACPWPVVMPLHPRTRGAMERYGLSAPGGSLHVIEAVGYVEMVGLMRHAVCVLTDSGGMQKEAYMLGVPCLTLRETTEWVETLEVGWNRLVEANSAAIHRASRSLPGGERPRPALYGDGRASQRIAEQLAAAIEVGFD